MILSIIIPAYNSGSTLQRCLESCISQINSPDVEIIIVNDGSIDDTPRIAREYQRQYQFVSVVNKINGGLSSARNAGISKASGKYLFFLDSDDWISVNSIKLILCACQEDKDIISIGYRLVYDDKTVEVIPKHNKLKTILSSLKFPMGAPFWIVKKSVLYENNISFCEGIFHEDNDYTPRLLYLARDVMFIDAPIYNYYINSAGSIISNPNIKKSFDLIKIINRYQCFVSNKVVDRDKWIFANLSMQALNACFYEARLASDNDKKRLFNELLNNKNTIVCMCVHFMKGNFKYRIESLAVRTCFHFFCKKMINL